MTVPLAFSRTRNYLYHRKEPLLVEGVPYAVDNKAASVSSSVKRAFSILGVRRSAYMGRVQRAGKLSVKVALVGTRSPGSRTPHRLSLRRSPVNLAGSGRGRTPWPMKQPGGKPEGPAQPTWPTPAGNPLPRPVSVQKGDASLSHPSSETCTFVLPFQLRLPSCRTQGVSSPGVSRPQVADNPVPLLGQLQGARWGGDGGRGRRCRPRHPPLAPATKPSLFPPSRRWLQLQAAIRRKVSDSCFQTGDAPLGFGRLS